MPPDECVEAPGHRRHVDAAVPPEPHAEGVRGQVGADAFGHPEVALQRGQRQVHPLGQAVGRALLDLGRSGDQLGDRRQRRRCEQLAQRQLHSVPLPQGADEPDRREGVASECQEVVVRPYLTDAEQGAPQFGDLGLRRRQALGGRGRLVGHLRQSPPVDLALRGERERRMPGQRGGDHVRRQAAAEPGAHRREVGPRERDDMADQALLPGAFLHQDDGVGHGVVRAQRGLDLARFDTEAADLHLVVEPAEEHQAAVGRLPDPVTGPVLPAAVGSGAEPVRGEVGPVQVARGHAGAADHQFSGVRLPALGVDDTAGDARQRVTDRHLVAVPPSQLGDGGHHGGLGRPVGVEQLHGGADRVLPAADQFGAGRLAADDHQPDRRREGGLTADQGRHELVPVGGRQVEDRDREVRAAVQEQIRSADHVLVAQHDRGAADERGEDLLDAGVEAQGRELQHAIAVVQAVPVHRGAAESVEGGPRYRDTLGPARRARREDDVRRARLSGPRPGPGGPVPGGPVLVDDDAGTGVLEHHPRALRRIRGIQGHVSGACPQDRQHRDDRPAATWQADPDQIPGPHPGAVEFRRKGRDLLDQLRVRRHVRLLDDRHRLRSTTCPCGDGRPDVDRIIVLRCGRTTDDCLAHGTPSLIRVIGFRATIEVILTNTV